MSSTDEDDEKANSSGSIKARKKCLKNGKQLVNRIDCVTNGHDPGEGCSGSNGKLSIKNIQSFNTINYSDSSSETEDDHCVYKYKGNGLETCISDYLPGKERFRARQGSPETDFLEMDFDPGVSNGHDGSDDSDCCDMGELCEIDDFEPKAEEGMPKALTLPAPPSPHMPPKSPEESYKEAALTEENPLLNLDWVNVEVPSKRLDFMDKDVQFEPGVKARIWSEKEAIEKEVIHKVSSCTGIAAVINTLNSFRISFDEAEVLEKLGVDVTSKCVNGSLSKYLFFRSTAGKSHTDLIKIIREISEDQLVCKFFGTYPPRRLDLSAFLFYWIRKGAVPILTFNPNRQLDAPSDTNAGMWHHRIVWSVSESEVYLSDPLECIPASTMYHLLSTQPTLFIDKGDLLSKWRPDEDLTPLVNEKNCLWKHHNVLGQVVNLLRDFMSGRGVGDGNHIEIPANFSCGITLILSKESPHLIELVHTPEVPLRNVTGTRNHWCLE